MAISKARQNFRRVLYVFLGFALCFFTLAAGTYGAIRTKYIKIGDIAPTLFAIDVAHYQTRAFFSDPDGQHDIAVELIHKGFFDRAYSIAGRNMIDDLIMNRHTPALKTKADILMRTAQKKEQIELAMALYEQAAAKNYTPAIAALNKVKN